ncbi:MAG: hypothetical protein ACRDH2_02145 [Anaerolineales bacterium]
MADAVALIAEYQNWAYALMGLGTLFYLRSVWQARQRLSQTPFGLERELAFRQQNSALAMILMLGALALSVYTLTHVVLPNMSLNPASASTPAPGQDSTPPSANPTTAGPIVVDSSGCSNPNATLSDPQANQIIAGSFEVRGTASIDNFAFFKIEINGAGTSGQWVSLDVGNTPVISGTLGSFDTSAYEPGEYALRLVVLDSAGNSPPPCTIAVMLSSLSIEATPP